MSEANANHGSRDREGAREGDAPEALFAVHVRTKHLHVVVHAFVDPDDVMNDFKAYASRGLNRGGFENRQRKRWTRHGSTRKLWTWESVHAAIQYVIHEQGEPMAVFEDLLAIERLEMEGSANSQVAPRGASVRETDARDGADDAP